LRPIVFGANDGLVSNLALVMGVAGANPAPGIIVLAGIAGLLAGAFSMGVGEYVKDECHDDELANAPPEAIDHKAMVRGDSEVDLP
jgi:vacuolar iron transporter family protein